MLHNDMFDCLLNNDEHFFKTKQKKHDEQESS